MRQGRRPCTPARLQRHPWRPTIARSKSAAKAAARPTLPISAGKRPYARWEGLEHGEHGNLPAWAQADPLEFWWAADTHERANGAVYREIEVALPRELTPAQRQELMHEFIQTHLGQRHTYTLVIHNPTAAPDGGEQPHVHLMFSERIQDGTRRDPVQYFKRYNAKVLDCSGCCKDSMGTLE